MPYNQHKKTWLQKVIGACYATYYEEQQEEKKVSLLVTTEMDMVLPNEVTVYHSSKQTVAQLSQLVIKYLAFCKVA